MAAGLTHAQAAEVLGSAESKVGRIENAQSGIRMLDLKALLDAYGVEDPERRAEIELLAREARKRGWWAGYAHLVRSAYATYVAVEWDAAEIYTVETNLVPGLLQTPAYTEAVVRLQTPDATPEHVATQISVRKERRKALTREKPLHLWAIVSESVLYHRVGKPKVMAEQLEYLLEASREKNIELQVLPRDDPMNACLFGPFVIMSFPANAETDVVYTESRTSMLYYEEPAEIDAYTTLFRRLNVAASSVSKSRALIRDALRELV
jgi:Domain of unknown function (DUF5753)/Helix-turn-helix domain